MSAPELPAPTTPVEAAARARDADRQLMLLLALQFAFGLAFSTFVLLPKILAASLHAGPAAIGRVMAMFAYAGVAAALLTGRRAARRGGKRLIIEGTLLMIASALGYLAVDRVGPLAMALRAAHGAAYAMVFVTGSAIAADLAPPGRMARTMALYGTSNLVTNALAPLLVEPLVDRFGPAAAYVTAAVASAVAGALATRLVEEAPAGQAPAAGGSLGAVLRRGRAVRLTLAIGLAGVALSAMFSFSQLMALSLGMRQVSGFFVAYTAAVLLVRLVLGGLIDRVGPQRASVGALLLYAAVVFSMRFLGVFGLSALGAAFGVAHGFLYPAAMALSVTDLPAAERGPMLTLANAGFIGGGAFVGPLGAFAARAGYPALYALCAAGALAAAALLWRWPIAGPRAVP
ncbi:MAG TPA: MFS transporter [Polyangia bacterium]|nr:MFS transporter [Polyangia bacterium]